MNRIIRITVPHCLTAAMLLSGPGITTSSVHAQFGLKENLIRVAVCGGGAYGGLKLGEKVAEIEARKLKLGADEARKHRVAIQIGMAMALCGGGVLVANTVFAKLSERDRKARERELEAAVQEAAPRSYVLPDNPNITATITPQPIVTEGNKECRTLEDVLAEGDRSDRALVKFCRDTGSSDWKVQKY